MALRDVEYPHCLDNPEQRVLDDMLRFIKCWMRYFVTNLSPTGTPKCEQEEVEVHKCIVGPSFFQLQPHVDAFGH